MEMDDLADFEGAGVYARVSGLDSSNRDTVRLGDRPKGIA